MRLTGPAGGCHPSRSRRKKKAVFLAEKDLPRSGSLLCTLRCCWTSSTGGVFCRQLRLLMRALEEARGLNPQRAISFGRMILTRTPAHFRHGSSMQLEEDGRCMKPPKTSATSVARLITDRPTVLAGRQSSPRCLRQRGMILLCCQSGQDFVSFVENDLTVTCLNARRHPSPDRGCTTQVKIL